MPRQKKRSSSRAPTRAPNLSGLTPRPHLAVAVVSDPELVPNHPEHARATPAPRRAGLLRRRTHTKLPKLRRGSGTPPRGPVSSARYSDVLARNCPSSDAALVPRRTASVGVLPQLPAMDPRRGSCRPHHGSCHPRHGSRRSSPPPSWHSSQRSGPSPRGIRPFPVSPSSPLALSGSASSDRGSAGPARERPPGGADPDFLLLVAGESQPLQLCWSSSPCTEEEERVGREKQ